MEYDPFYGSRTYRDRGANLPEPVHIPGEHHQQNNQHYYELDSQHGSQVSPPNNSPQDKPDIGPSTNDSPKPVHTLNADETANSGGRRISRRCTRKRVVIPIALLLTIVAIGAVLGGVLGTMLSAKQAPADNSPYFFPDNGDTLLGSKSQLANSFSKSAHVIVAQNEDGELMAVEFHGSKTDRYLLKNHTYDTELPNALGNTPLELVQFGSEEDLHLFYFDHAFRLAHVVRTNKDGRDVWTPGALMDGHLLSEPPADTVRLSVCVMSSDWSESGDSYLLVVYQMDNGEDGMVLLASSDPGSSESWNTHYFVMNTDELGESMNNESSGFLILPTTREKDDKMLPALRILWDLSDDEEKATFGSVECEFGGGYNLTDCIRTKDDWAGMWPLSLNCPDQSADSPSSVIR